MPDVPIRPPEWLRPLNDPIAAISGSPDGSRLAALTTDGQLAILEAASGDVIHRFTAHEGGAFQVAWHPKESVIASAGQDGRVRLWDPATGSETESIEAGAAWVDNLAWSPSGAYLAAGAGRRLTLWSHARRTVLHNLSDHRSTITALEWRRDERAVAVACYGTVRFYLPESGKIAETLPWKTSLISLALSPDNRWVAAGTQEQSVQIWELPYREGEELAMSGYPAKVRELAWHHSGRYLATGGGEGIMVWDCGGKGPAGTSPRILEGHTGRVSILRYPLQGHTLASGGQDGNVLFWNAGKSTTALRQVSAGSPVTALQWNAAAQAVAFGCHDGTVGVAKS